MNNRTPLQLLVAAMGGEPAADTADLKQQARALAKTPRSREVTEYLITAVEGHLPRSTKAGGSLKYVLWWLRDHAGELYEPAAQAVLKAALESNWPLSNALVHLAHLPILGVFLQDLQRPVDWRALARDLLQERRIGDLRVAVNTSLFNMTGPAMRLGYDVMVARSEKGAAIKARRGKRLDTAALPGSHWVQPYPDLVVWSGEVEAMPPLDDILAVLDKVVQ